MDPNYCLIKGQHCIIIGIISHHLNIPSFEAYMAIWTYYAEISASVYKTSLENGYQPEHDRGQMCSDQPEDLPNY